MVNAWCYTDSNCKASTLSDRLKCPQCARAQVSYISGSCTGTPPLQQITLNTTINIASGTISCFRWIYGDGQSGPMFTINNTAGTANTPYVHSEQHDYSPGSYTARLIVVNCQTRQLIECDEIPLSVTATCTQCPTIPVTADPPGSCINGKRSVTFHASINGVPATGTVLQWSFPNSILPSTTPFPVINNGALPDQIVDYPANISGSVMQTAKLQAFLPPNCPPVSVTVTIDPCPSCCPSITLSKPTVTGCVPGSAMVSFVATVPTWPTDCTPVTPSLYAWTLDGPGGRKYQRNTSQPNTDTSTPWTDAVSGNPATVQFASGGN